MRIRFLLASLVAVAPVVGAQSAAKPTAATLVAPDSSVTRSNRLCADSSPGAPTRDDADCSRVASDTGRGETSWRTKVAGVTTVGVAAVTLLAARAEPQSLFAQFLQVEGAAALKSLAAANANQTMLPVGDASLSLPGITGVDIAAFLAPLIDAVLPTASMSSVLGLGPLTLTPSAQLFLEAVQDDAVSAGGAFLSAGPGGILDAELHPVDQPPVTHGDDGIHPVAAPEPATLTLTLTGFLAMAGYARRRAR